jgi:hypothetical protein
MLGPGKGAITLSWDEFVKITGYDPAKKGNQVLTVPWSEVESLLGVDLKEKVGLNKSTVELPWTDFKALMEWSLKKRPDLEPPPPADYVVTSCQYKGALGADASVFTLTVKLNVLRKGGWKRIPILPATVAITSSKLPAGAYLSATPGNASYELLTDKSGEMEVVIDFSVQANKSAGISTVSFNHSLPTSSVVDLTVDDAQADVKVANSQSLTSKVADGKTLVLAAVPSGGNMNISWQRALPKQAAAPTKLYAETRTLVGVAEGVLVCQESIDLNILHTPVREVKLAAPPGASVLEVSGSNVQDWRADKDGTITVVLRGEALGTLSLRVSYESPFASAAASQAADGKVQVPVIRAPGVEREKGFVGVIALANVEIKAGDIAGATVVDVKELPAEISAMTKQPVLLGFRYVADKFAIPLAIKKHSEVDVLITIVDSALYTTMQLDDGRRMTRAIYTVRNNRNQFLRVGLPQDAAVWSVAVSGNTVSPAQDEKKNLLIPLVRSSATAQELTSFPVELVYVETPPKALPAAGKLHVGFPTMGGDTPVMHVMVNYYAPAEGKYGTPGGVFSPARSGFSGTLRVVANFATMVTDRDVVAKLDVQQQAQGMQKQFEGKMEQEAKDKGVTPIRVRLPLDGQLFKLEKILALPGDAIYFDLDYSDWKPAR